MIQVNLAQVGFAKSVMVQASFLVQVSLVDVSLIRIIVFVRISLLHSKLVDDLNYGADQFGSS